MTSTHLKHEVAISRVALVIMLAVVGGVVALGFLKGWHFGIVIVLGQTIMGTVIIAFMLRMSRLRVCVRALAEHRCIHCDYLLIGTADPCRCPECGTINSNCELTRRIADLVKLRVSPERDR